MRKIKVPVQELRLKTLGGGGLIRKGGRICRTLRYLHDHYMQFSGCWLGLATGSCSNAGEYSSIEILFAGYVSYDYNCADIILMILLSGISINSLVNPDAF